MKEFKNINEILDFAIGEEQSAVDFYLLLAAQSKSDETRRSFHDFAEEEMRHKANLTKIKENGMLRLSDEKVKDLKISEYLVDVKPSANMDYQEALTLAMKKEKAAFRMYSALAAQAEDPSVKQLLQSLAMEESRHKLRFEIEYDDMVFKEN
ncbi:MAG: ferritin family protein [Bacteroidetes bacterium]|nr:ferritin family protein [Bacteroidota bacterium]